MNERNVGSVFGRQNDNQMGMVLEPDILRELSEKAPPYFVQVESIMSSRLSISRSMTPEPSGKACPSDRSFQG